MAAVRKMLLVEARRSWETRGAPSAPVRCEELVTRFRPRVEMESEADLRGNGQILSDKMP